MKPETSFGRPRKARRQLLLTRIAFERKVMAPAEWTCCAEAEGTLRTGAAFGARGCGRASGEGWSGRGAAKTDARRRERLASARGAAVAAPLLPPRKTSVIGTC